jgi:hypothetical protein
MTTPAACSCLHFARLYYERRHTNNHRQQDLQCGYHQPPSYQHSKQHHNILVTAMLAPYHLLMVLAQRSMTPSGCFFLITGNASVNKTFTATALTASNTTNQLVLGTTTVSAPSPAAPRTYSLPDVGANAEFAFASSISSIPLTGRTFVQYNALPTNVGSNTLYRQKSVRRQQLYLQSNCHY